MTFPDDAPRPDGVDAVEVILDVAAEGGALTIEGTRTAHSWRFRMVEDEGTSYALLDDDDRRNTAERIGSSHRIGLTRWRRRWRCLISTLGTASFRCTCIPISGWRFGWRSRSDTAGAGTTLSLDRWRRLCHRRQTDRAMVNTDDLWLCTAEHQW